MEDLPFQSVQRRVVVVDDDSGMRRALRILLERRGYAVEEFATGNEFLIHLQAQPSPYCVILDLHLEDLNGFEIRRRIGKPDFPIILITGDTKAGASAEAGLFQAVLFKPLDWLDLCTRLKGFQMAEPM